MKLNIIDIPVIFQEIGNLFVNIQGMGIPQYVISGTMPITMSHTTRLFELNFLHGLRTHLHTTVQNIQNNRKSEINEKTRIAIFTSTLNKAYI